MLLPVVKILIGQTSWHRGCPLWGALAHKHLSADGILVAIRLAYGRLDRHIIVAVVHQDVVRSIGFATSGAS